MLNIYPSNYQPNPGIVTTNQTSQIQSTIPLASSSLDMQTSSMTGEELSRRIHWQAGPDAAGYVLGKFLRKTFSDSCSAKSLDSATRQWMKNEGFSLSRDINDAQWIWWFGPSVTPLQQALFREKMDIVDQLLTQVTKVDSKTLLMEKCLRSYETFKKILDSKKINEEELIKALDALSRGTFTPSPLKIMPGYSPDFIKMLHNELLTIPSESPRTYHLPFEMLKRLFESIGKNIDYNLAAAVGFNSLLNILIGPFDFTAPIKNNFHIYTSAVHAAKTKNYDILKELIRLGAPIAPIDDHFDYRSCPFYQILKDKSSPDLNIIDFMTEEAIQRGDWEIGYLFAVAKFLNPTIAVRMEEKFSIKPELQSYQFIKNGKMSFVIYNPLESLIRHGTLFL